MTRPPRSRVALNPIPWFSLKEDPADPDSADLWLIADPAFRAQYPEVLRQVKRSGFDHVMLGVLETQTVQDFARSVEDAGLGLAPGYASVDVPEHDLPRGSAERVHWFDGVRRKAEESAYFGLTSIFLAPELNWRPGSVRATTRTAVGAGYDRHRLDRLTEVLGEAADVLAAEGVRAGLHPHVGTWVETVEELDHVLAATDPARLGASLDVGHLAWLGVDPVEVVARHADRLVDLHVKDLDTAVAARSREVPTLYGWAPARGLFQDPGEGDLDLDGVLDALPDGFDGWVVIEVDRTHKDPFDSAVACAAWADRSFGR